MNQSSIQHILDSTVGGTRLSQTDAEKLLASNQLSAIGRASHAMTRQLHPEPYRTYNIDRNINYTIICTAVCDFCAFYRSPKHAEGYVLERSELLKKIEETVELGGDQILMQGGLHPSLPLEWYEELLRDIKSHFPQINIHGFSPPEIYHFTKISKKSLPEVLERLARAGLGSLPGGGGEILVDRVRKAMTRGLTGKTITPDLYIMVAISGASQHMAGCSGAKVIVAINKDAEANIFKEARYGVVGDWESVLPALTAALRDLTQA